MSIPRLESAVMVAMTAIVAKVKVRSSGSRVAARVAPAPPPSPPGAHRPSRPQEAGHVPQRRCALPHPGHGAEVRPRRRGERVGSLAS